jgi:hypothetical protein
VTTDCARSAYLHEAAGRGAAREDLRSAFSRVVVYHVDQRNEALALLVRLHAITHARTPTKKTEAFIYFTQRKRERETAELFRVGRDSLTSSFEQRAEKECQGQV